MCQEFIFPYYFDTPRGLPSIPESCFSAMSHIIPASEELSKKLNRQLQLPQLLFVFPLILLKLDPIPLGFIFIFINRNYCQKKLILFYCRPRRQRCPLRKPFRAPGRKPGNINCDCSSLSVK